MTFLELLVVILSQGMMFRHRKKWPNSKKLLRAAKVLYFLFHIITKFFKHSDNKTELKYLYDTIKIVSNYISDYINKAHGRIYGLTPNEILNGNIPFKDNYQQDMIRARKNRFEQNRLIECCENK